MLELQKRKLELEVAATKKHIEEQEKQLNKISTKSSNDVTAAKIETSTTAGVSRPPTSSIPINPNQVRQTKLFFLTQMEIVFVRFAFCRR